MRFSMNRKTLHLLLAFAVLLLGGELHTPVQEASLQRELQELRQQGVSVRFLDNAAVEVRDPVSGLKRVKTVQEPSEVEIRAWASARGIPILEIDPATIDTNQWSGWYRYWTQVPITNNLGTPTVVGDANRDGKTEVYGPYRQFTSTDFETRCYQIDSLGVPTLVFNYVPRQGNSQQMVDVDGDSLLEVAFTIGGQLNDFEQDSRNGFPTRLNFSHERYERGSFGYTGIYLGSLDGDQLIDFLYKGSEADSTDTTRGVGKTYVGEYDSQVNNFRRVWSKKLSATAESSVGGYATGDFDVDGKTEFIASELFGQVHLVENIGDNSYVETWRDSLPFVNAYYQGSGDVDIDGKPEFFVGATMSNGNWTTVYEADSNNHYSAKLVIHLLSGGSLDDPTYITSDVDRDGKLECVISSGADLYVFKSNGDDIYYLWYLRREESRLSMQVHDFNDDGKKDFMIGKAMTDAQGNIRLYSDIYLSSNLTEVATRESSNANNLATLEIMPNPSNPDVAVTYTLPWDATVSLKVFDLLGRDVKTLWDGIQSSGRHSIVWSAHEFASGIYFVRLQSSTFRLMKKTIVVR
jgi:hypothetical protein